MPARKPRIVVVGSSNTDMIVRMPRLPRPGETVIGGTFQVASGGKGANQAVAAARAGADVILIARIGNDDFGRRTAAALSVTRLGAQPSAPGRKEIEDFLKKGRVRT